MTTKLMLWYLCALGGLVVCSQSYSQIIYQQKSLYQDISVMVQDDMRCLVFAAVKGKNRFQTCQYEDVADQRLLLTYSRMSFAGLLLNPEPKRILIVGLGGGVIPGVMSQLYPQAKIDIVELDPAVVKVAKNYFHFRQGERMSVIISDARVYIKRAILQHQNYDYIVLDAFNSDYIPEHLMTREFLQEVRQLMTNDGVLVANTFSTSQLYDHESVTYRKVFGSFFNFKIPDESGNRIIIASKILPPTSVLKYQAQQLAGKLIRYGIRIKRYPRLMSVKPDWDTAARQLTDQYSPANLLR
jgi:spermidine synthase